MGDAGVVVESGRAFDCDDDDKGWFDVQAYSTRDRWEGPELHDAGVDGFMALQSAILAAQREEYAGCHEVVVVAYGKHTQYEPGETVFSLRNRPAGCDYNKPSVAAAEAALSAHKAKLGVEGDDSIQLWHLLLSLKEWAAASGVDFAREEAAGDRELRSGRLCMPAAEKTLKDAVGSGKA